MLKKSILLSCVFALSGLFLTACNRYVAESDKRIETTLERAEDYYARSSIPDVPEQTDTVRIRNDVWLGDESVKIMEGDALPSWLEGEDGITIVIAEDATFSDIVQQISDLTSIPVRLDDLVNAKQVPDGAVPVKYSGKLSGLLNYLAGRYGVYWQYKDKMISFFAQQTRVFTVFALPTETSVQASLTGATMGEGGSGGNASSSFSTSATLALWDSIEEGVKQVVGENGKLSFSRVSGTVTVTASPFIIRKVSNYIDTWNEKLSRQVAITVRILQVTVNNTDNYGLDLAGLFATDKFTLASAGVYALTGGSTAETNLTMTLLKPKKLANTEAAIQAFSSQGKARLVTSSTITTMNNKVAPVQITQSKNYLKKVSTTTSGSGTDQTTEVDTEVDTLTWGFTMDILPRILDHGRLILMFAMTLTDLVSMEPYSTLAGDNKKMQDAMTQATIASIEKGEAPKQEDTKLQMPHMSMRGFMQEIAMRSGYTLVLSGFEQIRDDMLTSGVGKPKMGLLGGRAYDKTERDIIVILLTPEVLQSPLSQETLVRDY